MQKRLIQILFGCVGLCITCFAGETGVKLPEFASVRLENGVTLLLMERHQIPLASIHWMMKSAGTVTDPEGREGLASVTAELLRKGTQTRTADEISESIDFVGASMDAAAQLDFASGSAECVSKDLLLLLELVADTLQHPSFPSNEIAKLIKQDVDSISDEKAVPNQVLGRYFQRALFGTHPYGRPVSGSETSLPTLDRAQIQACYANHYSPDRLTIAIVGDFKSADVEKRARVLFEPWPKASAPRPSLETPKRSNGRHALLVEKPDATQTFFSLGNIGLPRTSPDWVPLQVVNTLFGGRFTSMINTELRIKSGLTYGARSSFDEHPVAGKFAISSFTRNDTTAQALDMTLAVLTRLHKEGITEAQLASAKAYIKGQFGPTLETTSQLASTLLELDFYGEGPDYINSYFERIDAVTLADTKRLVSTYYPSDDLALVLIGKRDVIEPCAKKLGAKIEMTSITAPGF